MSEVRAGAGWCAERLHLPSLLGMRILFQENAFLGRPQRVSRVKWISKQQVLALVPSHFLIRQVKL